MGSGKRKERRGTREVGRGMREEEEKSGKWEVGRGRGRLAGFFILFSNSCTVLFREYFDIICGMKKVTADYNLLVQMREKGITRVDRTAGLYVTASGKCRLKPREGISCK